MKALFRSALIQSALAYLFAAYMRLAISTMRWTHVDRERAQGVWKSEGGAMLCLGMTAYLCPRPLGPRRRRSAAP